MEWNLRAGHSVDGWILTDRLGSGGNGEVWIANHLTLGRAALKLLKLQFQGQENKRYLRFRDEATMHEQLAAQHWGVLPFVAYSLPENPNRETPAWLATQVAKKTTDALQGMPLREAVETIAAVADTLAALHERGIAHRDVKPDNILWYEGRWVVGDFGLVDYPDKDSLTDTGERLGPYHYLAPEMLNEANRSDGRMADVFSLGKTLWVLATEQRTPPPGELRADNNQLSIQAYRAAPRVHQLDGLVDRATRFDPARRPTMREFAAELRAWLSTPKEPAQADLTDVLARIRALAPPALRSEADRAGLLAGFERLSQALRNGMTSVAQKLKGTGLSDGSVGSSVYADPLFKNQLAHDYVRGTNFVCGAALPVGAGAVRLSCSVVVNVYPDGTAQFFGAYRVGQGNLGDRAIGATKWAGVLGSAAQDQAVAALFSSLNENLVEALRLLAECAENQTAQRR